MYQRDDNAGAAARDAGTPGAVSPGQRAGHALARVRQALDEPAGLTFDRGLVEGALSVPLDDPALEAERCFARGWLHWLAGETGAAEPLLGRAVELLPPRSEAVARAAYWLARVRLLLRRADAIPAYESVLRSTAGSPRATCWFVDLLWRAGRHERAEQVWKPLRTNRRVTACDEAPLLEARFQLRQGDAIAAEKALREGQPRGGVNRVECLLLLAWVVADRQPEQAEALLDRAAGGLYPAAAVKAWRALLRDRTRPPPPGDGFASLRAPPLSAPAAGWVEAQAARASGADATSTSAALAAVRALPPLCHFARYALACAGREDFAALLADRPGPFLAVRCRLWLTFARFGRREVGAADLLTALQQAVAAGHGVARLDDWRGFVEALASQGAPRPADLWPSGSDDVVARNRRRAAVELAAGQPPRGGVLPLLLSWARGGGCERDAVLRGFAGRQLLRLLLRRHADGRLPGAGPGEDARKPPAVDEVLGCTRELLGPSALTDLVAGLLAPHGNEGCPTTIEGEQAGADCADVSGLWRAAVALARGEVVGEKGPAWRAAVASLRDDPSAGGPALSLLAFEAARSGEAAALVDALRPAPAWVGRPSGPPCFLARGVQAAGPGALRPERWRRAVSEWLRQWKLEGLSPAARDLAVAVGLLPPDPDTAAPPAGVDAAAWFLHQAGEALGRDDALAARAWARRALSHDATPLPAERSRLVQAALPELERRAQAQLLAEVARPDPRHARAAPALFVDMRDLLFEVRDGPLVLAAAGRGELADARARLGALAERPDLPPRLCHHLALVSQRAAVAFEEEGRADDALACWQRSWRCWLSWAARPTEDGAGAATVVELLLGHLLALHRGRLKDLLARGQVDAARRFWDFVRRLAELAPEGAAPLTDGLRRRLEAFREELATEYLLETREAMRHGGTPEGWRADYEEGLGRLRRLLSLDRDNPRLLIALVEACADWFLDLYDTQDAGRLRAEVERYTPFALQLARAVRSSPPERSPDHLTARAALSEFFKFRGFVADDRDRKKSLYREALQLNPANENVRTLLAELESLG